MADPSNVKVGDKIFINNEKRGYKVRARDERYIIATKPYNPQHTVLYFIIDLVREVRGADNMVFGMGYETDEEVADRLEELQNGTIEVSSRNYVDTIMVDKIEVSK